MIKTAGLIATLSVICMPAIAQPVQLHVHVSDQKNGTDIAAASAFANAAVQAGDGDLIVQFTSGIEVCANDSACLQALEDGLIDLTVTDVAVRRSAMPMLDLFDIPYVFGDQRALAQAIVDAPDPSAPVRLLAVTPGDTLRVIANTRRRISAPADISDLRFFANGRQAVRAIKGAGGAVVPMPKSAMPAALQTGEIDGAVLDMSELMQARLPMVGLQYATRDPNSIHARLWWMRSETYDALTERQRAAVDLGILALGDAAQSAATGIRAQAVSDFQKAGGDYYVLGGDELAAFQQAVAPIVQQLRSDVDAVDGIMSLLSAN